VTARALSVLLRPLLVPSRLRPDHGASALGRWDDGGTWGKPKAARRLERCESSVAHEHPSTDEHGLLRIEQRECRARDVPNRSSPRGGDRGPRRGQQCRERPQGGQVVHARGMRRQVEEGRPADHALHRHAAGRQQVRLKVSDISQKSRAITSRGESE